MKLMDFEKRIADNDNVAPAGWKFDPSDWWVEEHGLIMSTPQPLPRKSIDKVTKEILPEKKYIVTGDRSVTTVLTVRDNGSWELEKGTLYDVTHLPCRSAAYRGSTCLPQNANLKDFPVKPGAEMPPIEDARNKIMQSYSFWANLYEEIAVFVTRFYKLK